MLGGTRVGAASGFIIGFNGDFDRIEFSLSNGREGGRHSGTTSRGDAVVVR